MLHSSNQPGLGTLSVEARRRESTFLDDLHRFIDWDRFRPLLTPLYQREGGRPALDPVAMLKLVFVQRLYTLSDEEVVRQLFDRRSFERFVGLDRVESSSLTRFRKRLAKAGVGLDGLLDTINGQIALHGFTIERGSIVDASLVPSRHRPDATWKEGPQAGQVIDPDVGTTVREHTDRAGRVHRTTHRGMKLHLRSSTNGLIQRVRVTTNRTHDTLLFPDLIESGPPCEIVYADRGYDSAKNRAVLYRQNIRDAIMRRVPRGKAHKRRTITERNDRLKPARAPVEHIFGVMKRTTTARFRYRSAATNLVQATVDSIVYNLRRFIRWKTGLMPSLYVR